MMTKMPRDQWKRIVDSGFVAIVTVLAFSHFRLTTFDVRISRQKSSKSANRVFYISVNKGYSEKQSFLVYFQLGIIS